jgi:hypothetical protein
MAVGSSEIMTTTLSAAAAAGGPLVITKTSYTSKMIVE